MKTNLYKLLGVILLMSFVTISFGQAYEIRTFENEMGYLEVQMRETNGGTDLPSNTNGDLIGDITYAIRWSSSLGTDLAFLCTSSVYNMRDPSGIVQTDQLGWHYRYYTANNTPFTVPTDWVQNEWETIATYYATGGSGSGTFEIAPQSFGISTLNWSIADDGSIPYVQFTPTINGNVSYPYPTIVYTHVWVGGASGDWDGFNWETECGALSIPPAAANNVYIPDVSGASGNFPSSNSGTAMACDNLRIGAGASLTVPATNGSLAVGSKLFTYGTLTIVPNADATISGNTYIDAAEGLVVEADATGVGSFIDNGTITYGTSGTAKVQTYLSNGAIVNSFYMHTVGPTLDEENYTGSGTGAFLQAFDVAPGNTYAYSWSEASNVWVSQFSNTYPVLTTDGIGLSTDDATPYTMDMVGTLMTGAIPSVNLGHGNSNYELISNPYPSAIDFNVFYTNPGNSTIIANKNWIWDASTGNYLPNAGGTPPEQYIQVGQGFFVQTLSAGTVNFLNTDRVHSNAPFRDVAANLLTLNIAGGNSGFEDVTYIRFEEGATTGYDDAIEAIKWNSMYSNATMIRSIAEDGTELSINVMPQLDLQGEMVSVPVDFQCGYEGEYTFTASDLESFEYGTEIWIEDKQDGNAWHHFSPGHDTYTFTASPDDAHDRFIIHFFGPTGVDEFSAKNVLIYGDNEYALIRNMTKNEVITEVYIYSLGGNMILHKQVPEQNNYRFFVSNHDNYYIVRVVTDKSIYTEKVFIH